MASHKLPLNSLSIGVQEFSYHLDGSFFNDVEATEVNSASVDAQLRVDKKEEGIYRLSFRFSGELMIPCDRCLDDMTLCVDTTYDLTVKEGDEYDDSDEKVLDLTPLMRDTVLLTIPLMHVHPEGACNAQMLNKLQQMRAVNLTDEQLYAVEPDVETTNPSSGSIDPRWEALKKLTDNN